MSNSIAPGSSADVNVRVTALTTNPNVPVTYKTIILKKNLVNGVNTLTIQEGQNINITQSGSTMTISTTGGSGGTSDYTELTNKPSINSVTLNGNNYMIKL